MGNQVNNNDVSKWAIRLKSNWKKGVLVLDYVMQAPGTASEFIDDGNGLLCVYGVLDRNSLELANVIEKHGYGDRAVTRYLNIMFGWDQPNVAAITASQEAMTAIAASKPAMTAVAASSTAMAAIWQNAAAVQAVKNNASAWTTFTGASSAVMGKTVAILAGLNPASFADMAAIAASSTAMTAVAASSTAIAANVTACQAVEASSAAKAALFNSPLAKTITGQGATNAWTNRRSGKVWLVWHRQTWSAGTSTLQVRYTVVNNQTISNTADQTYNTDCRVDRFMSGIENFASAGGIGNVVSYRFIPC